MSSKKLCFLTSQFISSGILPLGSCISNIPRKSAIERDTSLWLHVIWCEPESSISIVHTQMFTRRRYPRAIGLDRTCKHLVCRRSSWSQTRCRWVDLIQGICRLGRRWPQGLLCFGRLEGRRRGHLYVSVVLWSLYHQEGLLYSFDDWRVQLAKKRSRHHFKHYQGSFWHRWGDYLLPIISEFAAREWTIAGIGKLKMRRSNLERLMKKRHLVLLSTTGIGLLMRLLFSDFRKLWDGLQLIYYSHDTPRGSRKPSSSEYNQSIRQFQLAKFNKRKTGQQTRRHTQPEYSSSSEQGAKQQA